MNSLFNAIINYFSVISTFGLNTVNYYYHQRATQNAQCRFTIKTGSRSTTTYCKLNTSVFKILTTTIIYYTVHDGTGHVDRCCRNIGGFRTSYY